MTRARLVCLQLAIAIGVVVLGPSTIDAQRSSRRSPLDGITGVVQKHIDAGTIPGAVVLVAHDGQIIYWEAHGVADTTSNKPLQRDTVFWVASLTKPLVAASIMMMVEEGKVRLDDPVSRFIPEFKTPAKVRVLKPGSVAPARGASPT